MPVIVRAYKSNCNEITMLGSYYMPIQMVYNAICKLYSKIAPRGPTKMDIIPDRYFYVLVGTDRCIEGIVEGDQDPTPEVVFGHDKYGFENLPGIYVDPGCNTLWTDLVQMLDKLQESRHIIGDDDLLPIIDI